jgi:hypothetical protein
LRVPKGYWTEEAQREALEKLGREQLGVKELDDWYSVPVENVKLSFVGNYYKGSLFAALKRLYPHHNWNRLRLSRMPNGYWQQPETATYYYGMFMEWKRLGFQTLCGGVSSVLSWS